MSDPNPISEAENDAVINEALAQSGQKIQLQIAESLAEIAIQLQALNGHLEAITGRLSGIGSSLSQRR